MMSSSELALSLTLQFWCSNPGVDETELDGGEQLMFQRFLSRTAFAETFRPLVWGGGQTGPRVESDPVATKSWFDGEIPMALLAKNFQIL